MTFAACKIVIRLMVFACFSLDAPSFYLGFYKVCGMQNCHTSNGFCMVFIERSFYNIYGIFIFYWSNCFHHFPNGVILLNTDATKQRVGFDSYDNSINVSMELSIYGK